MRFASTFLSSSLAVAVLAACQTNQSVSVSEARKITAEYSGSSIQAPPRSSADVLELIARYDKPVDPNELAKRRELLNSSEPISATNLMNRAIAYYDIGETALSVETARKAVRQARIDPPNGYAEFLGEAARMEFSGGDFQTAYDLLKESVAKGGGKRAQRYSRLGMFEVIRGNLPEAKELLDQTRAAAAGSSSDYNTPRLASHIAYEEGRWADSEAEAIKGLSQARRQNSENPRRLLNWYRARSTMNQGRIDDAELLVRGQLQYDLELFDTSKNSVIAFELTRLSSIYSIGGRYEDAIRTSRVACDILDEMTIGWASLQRETCARRQAQAHLAIRNFDQARQLYDEIKVKHGGANPSLYESRTRKDPSLYLSEILTGASPDIRSNLEKLARDREQKLGPKHYRTAEAKALLAGLMSRSGDAAEALPLFRDAFSIMTTRSRKSGGDEGLANRRFALLAELYLDALADVIGRSGGQALVDEAFIVASQARAQSVGAAVSSSASRAQLGDPDLADLARREQDALHQISALYGLVASASSNGGSSSDIRVLRSQIDELRSARAAIFQEIEARYPDYAELINPKPPGRAAVQAALRPGEAMVSFYFTETRGLTFVVPKSGPIRMVESPVSRREIASRVAKLRRALDPNAVTLGDIPTYDLATAHSIYRDLLAPAEGALSGAERLVVVSHADLGLIPLAVLTTRPGGRGGGGLLFAEYRGAPWLARKWSTFAAPSEAAFVALRQTPPASASRRELVAFGDPVFGGGAGVEVASADAASMRGLKLRRRAAPATLRMRSATISALPPLPDTREEVEAIALALNADLSQDVFVGAEATESRVKTANLSDRRVLVFATHGLVPGDLDGLSQPALALSSPAVDGGQDGLLTLSEILGLKLDADWVVLSACNTGAGDGVGGEAISGLGRAFFYAGARSLLVSGWPVETTSARLLTTSLFERQKTENLEGAEALQRASLELADTGVFTLPDGRDAFAYAHPLFWAPFFIVGDGGV